ncbi:MAG: ThuA domain-containing protein [Bacteroidota bacterium]
MHRNLIFILFILLFFACENKNRPSNKILIFSKTDAFRHASIDAGVAAVKNIAVAKGMEVTTTENASVFTEENLSTFGAVVFLNTSGDVLNNIQQTDFQRFIEAGGGFIGIHGAASTEYNWAWYGHLVGAYFSDHPAVQEADVKIKDPSHPINAGLVEGFSIEEEWYNFRPVPPSGKVWVDAPNTVLTKNNIGPLDPLRQLEKHIDPRVAWRYEPTTPFLADEINVLLEVDEVSYGGGTHGSSHPISWQQEFNGGRSFYTALGHRSATFENTTFLRHLSNAIDYAIGKTGLDYTKVKTERIPPEDRFVRTTLASNLAEPTELEFLPDGRILFLERRGGMKMYDPVADSVRLVLQMPVYHKNENGFLGIGLDPDWEENHYIYLFYSLMEGGRRNRLSRFEFDGEVVHLHTEVVMLEVPEIDGCCHTGGSIEFDSKGNLFLSTGDNTNPFESDGYSPSDGRPGRELWDARRSAGNTNDLRGKILRITPQPDGSYTIPEGNLFPEGTPNTRPEIFVMGCRNPYRIAIDSQTDCLYWGDVGPDAGKDGRVRGPKGYDTFNRACGPVNAGWPFVRGNHVYQKYNFATKVSDKHFDPDRIINESPFNTGLKELPPVTPPLIWYSYDESTEFPWTEDGGKNPMAGPIFHAADFAEGTPIFPAYFENKFFAYEWMRDWIFTVTLDENGSFVQADPFLPNEKFNNPMDMAFGPDGALYILEYGESWFTQNEDARLTKIEFALGNRKPIAKVNASKTIGSDPLEVKFSSSKSVDYDGDKMQYEWKIGKKTMPSTAANFTHTFTRPGTYEVSLKIKDAHGAQSRDKVQILVGNEQPAVEWTISGNQSFYFGEMEIPYAVTVSDREDGHSDEEQIDPRRLRLSIDYLKEGKDVAEIILGHQTADMAAGGSMKYAGGKLAMDNSDCATCHAADRKVNGPSYIDIANRYFGDANAVEFLSDKVIKGGAGNWGESAMAAHPAISKSEAESIVQYILSFAGEVNTESALPMKGSYVLNEHLGREEKGAYIFQATYSDSGANGIASLSASSTHVLRYPKLEAENCSDKSKGIRKIKETDSGNTLLTGLTHDRFISFENIDLTGIQSVQFGFYEKTNLPEGTAVEVRIGRPNGKLIGRGDLVENESSVDISPTDEFADVFFVFKNDNKKEEGLGMLDWVMFGF